MSPDHPMAVSPPADPAAPHPTPTPAGTIHDIGYRHHDGPRLGRPAIRRALLVESARGAYGLGRSGRAKVMPLVLLAAMALPALIIVVVTAVTGSEELVAGYTGYVISTQVVIAIYVAGQAPASVSRDLRFGVMSLYLSRPLERADYVQAKVAALSLAVFALIATPLTILFLGALVAGLPLGEQLPDYLRTMAGAAVLACVLAPMALLIAAVTPRRGLGVAAVIAVLLVLAGVQEIAWEVAIEMGATQAASYAGLFSPFTLVDGLQSWLLGADSVMDSPPQDLAAGMTHLLVTVAVLVACDAALLWRYRRVSVA